MRLTKEEYIAKYNEDDAVGWQAIDLTVESLYPNQKERHYGTMIPFGLGGEDPLRGLSIYDTENQQFHRHIVSYGMSELFYDPEQTESEDSGWGFEFTFRIIPYKEDPDVNNVKQEPQWALNVMQNLARYVFNSGNVFAPYHFVPTNGPIRLDCNTKLVGLAFVPDPELGKIDSPNGEIQFLQMVGLTQDELDWLWEEPTTARCKSLIELIKADNPLLITDLNRTKSYVTKRKPSFWTKIKNLFSK